MNGERWDARVRRSAAQLAERRDVVVDISLEEDPPIRVTNPRVLMGYENADDYPGSLARRLAVRGRGLGVVPIVRTCPAACGLALREQHMSDERPPTPAEVERQVRQHAESLRAAGALDAKLEVI